MITLWAVTALLFFTFIYQLIKDKRQFKNGILLLLTSGMLILSLNAQFSNVKAIYLTTLILAFTVFAAMVIAAFMMFAATGWMIYRDGISVQAVLPVGFAVGIIAMLIIMLRFSTQIKGNKWLAVFVMMIGFELLYLGLTFVSFLIYSIFYAVIPKQNDYDYILIHGARVFDTRPSRLLVERICKGISLYEKSGKKAKIIASGGQGSDEKISEAQAIKEYVISRGVNGSDIIIEDKSTNTMENLKFSRSIIDDKNAKYAFVTNNYHALRVSIFARQLGMSGDAFGCRTALYYLPAGFIREYIAMLVQEKKTFIVYTAAMLIVSALTAALFM